MPIPQFNPSLGPDEAANVLRVMEDQWLTEGPWTARLQQDLAEYCGCPHVLMVPNGTLALFVALKVLGVGAGDEVLVPDFTFFGTASAVILAGAKPVLVDVRRSDFTMDPAAAERAISPATRCIMPVHMYGQSCDMTALCSLARRHDLLMVEDAAQGMGVTFGARHVGTFGEVGCISFFADKTMTTGEGGALLVQDPELAKSCLYFKNQGRLERGSFIHPRLGYNFRITDLQAAVGVAQFDRLEAIIRRKHEISHAYQDALTGANGQFPPGIEWPTPNGYGRSVPFRINILCRDAGGMVEHLTNAGVNVRRFFYPLHRQPALGADNCVVRETPTVSQELFERGVSLPSGIDLSLDQIRYVCRSIRTYADQNGPKEGAPQGTRWDRSCRPTPPADRHAVRPFSEEGEIGRIQHLDTSHLRLIPVPNP